jgi:hypothetical protein
LGTAKRNEKSKNPNNIPKEAKINDVLAKTNATGIPESKNTKVISIKTTIISSACIF